MAKPVGSMAKRSARSKNSSNSSASSYDSFAGPTNWRKPSEFLAELMLVPAIPAIPDSYMDTMSNKSSQYGWKRGHASQLAIGQSCYITYTIDDGDEPKKFAYLAVVIEKNHEGLRVQLAKAHGLTGVADDQRYADLDGEEMVYFSDLGARQLVFPPTRVTASVTFDLETIHAKVNSDRDLAKAKSSSIDVENRKKIIANAILAFVNTYHDNWSSIASMSVDTLAASADLINTVETKLKEVQHNQDTQEHSRGLGTSKINCRIAARVILNILRLVTGNVHSN